MSEYICTATNLSCEIHLKVGKVDESKFFHTVTDCWPAYKRIPRIAQGVYTHANVNHSQNFVDPNNPEVQAENVESTWSHVKEKIRRQHNQRGKGGRSRADAYVHHEHATSWTGRSIHSGGTGKGPRRRLQI